MWAVRFCRASLGLFASLGLLIGAPTASAQSTTAAQTTTAAQSSATQSSTAQASSSQCATPQSSTPLQATATPLGNASVSLTWAALPGAASYNVYAVRTLIIDPATIDQASPEAQP